MCFGRIQPRVTGAFVMDTLKYAEKEICPVTVCTYQCVIVKTEMNVL